MNQPLHDRRYPGESDEYRAARDELLRAELEWIAQAERLAEMRRALPLGGPLVEDYVFEEGPADLRDTQTVNEIRLSELFGQHDTLVLINTMWAPDHQRPCTSCNSLADTYNASAQHVAQRAGFALVTRAPLARLRQWAGLRGWRDIRLLSSFNNTFNQDYLTQTADDSQIPSITVFRRDEDGNIHHHYSVEGHWVTPPEGRDGRMLDAYWPLWNLLDLTPEGRGDWYPDHSY